MATFSNGLGHNWGGVGWKGGLEVGWLGGGRREGGRKEGEKLYWVVSKSKVGEKLGALVNAPTGLDTILGRVSLYP